jgi:hypothetical protein
MKATIDRIDRNMAAVKQDVAGICNKLDAILAAVGSKDQ